METPIDNLLDKIRLNCVYLTNKHINNHLYYKHGGNGLMYQLLFCLYLLVHLA